MSYDDTEDCDEPEVPFGEFPCLPIYWTDDRWDIYPTGQVEPAVKCEKCFALIIYSVLKDHMSWHATLDRVPESPDDYIQRKRNK